MSTSPEYKRKTAVSIANKLVREGSGSSAEHLRKRTERQIIPDLKSILGDTPFVIVGGIATRQYMPERTTYDVDILIRCQDEQDVASKLCAAGAKEKGLLAIGGRTWELSDQTALDVVVLEDEWIEVAVADPVLSGDGLPCIKLPYLVLMKLRAGRMQDLADISRMVGGAEDKVLDEVRASIKKYSPTETEDLESLIKLGKLEFDSQTD